MLAFEYTPFVWPLLLALTIGVVLMVNAWNHRQVTGARTFGLLVLTVSIWIFCYTLELTSVNPAAKDLWLRVKYLGVAHLPLAFLVFALEYGGQAQWLTRRNILLAEAVVLFNLVMALSNPLHGQFWTAVWVGEDGIQRVAQGPFFWVTITFNYLLFVSGMVALALTWRRAERLYRRQISLVFLGSLVPLIGNALTITHLSPVSQLDLTPFGFTVTGVMVGWALFQFQLLDIVPVAHAAIFKGIEDGVIVLDLQNRVVAFNPAAHTITGIAPAEAIGMPAREVFSPWRDLLDRYHDAKSALTELAIGDGADQLHFELSISPLADGHGNYTGRMIVLHDITQRVRTLEERDRLITELDAFAHTVAHDLKNPLGVVMTYADFLVRDDDVMDEAKHAWILQTVARNAHRMRNIIDELLLLGSVRQADVPLEQVDMGLIVSIVQDRLAQLIEECAPVIVVPESWPVAIGYQPWVEEVLANYVSNAIKYGGEPPLVELGAEACANEMVRFWVKDNGSGIAEEYHSSIFEQFTRLDVQRVEGHGLGLSIVKRIVDKLGGEVGVESSAEGGSTFSFTLPADCATALIDDQIAPGMDALEAGD